MVQASDDRKHRVQILMPKRSVERLDQLVIETESASYAEVVKNALKLYEAAVEGVKDGGKLYLERDGQREQVLLMV